MVFASSNHVTGFYRQDETIAPADPVRPDGYYGLSKAFGENLSRFYSRTSGGKFQLDVREIRAAFLEADQGIQRARTFRAASSNP